MTFTCGINQLPSITEDGTTGCQAVDVLDLSGDGTPDAIALVPGAMPELLLIDTAHPLIKGMDVEGDGTANYFWFSNGEGRSMVYPDIAGAEDPVRIALNDGTVAGLDSDGDGFPDELGASDVTPPRVGADVPAGRYGKPIDVTLRCNDDQACNAIAYTTDGSVPAFEGAGTVIAGGKVQMRLGFGMPPAQTLRFKARDSAGNETALQSLAYEFDPACTGPLAADAGADQTVNPGEAVTLDASASAGSGLTYTWRQTTRGDAPDVMGGAGVLTGPAPSFAAPATVTTVVLALSVTNAAGCTSAPDTVLIHVMRDKASGIFVDPVLGKDANSGQRQAPVATLSRALGLSQSTGVKDLYLTNRAGQPYKVTQTLPANVSLLGGFDSDWVRYAGQGATRLHVGETGLLWSAAISAPGVELSGLRIQAKGTASAQAVSAQLSDSGQLTLERVTLVAGATAVSNGSVYGLRTTGSGNATIAHSMIYAAGRGKGASGAHGMDGLAGEKGQGGGGGECISLVPGSGGRGGDSALGAAQKGGKGGKGGGILGGGDDGADSPGGAQGGEGGGTGGLRDGQPGANGVNGVEGAGGMAAFLVVSDAFTQDEGANGTDGTPGTLGTGGGGGGGSGGFIYCAGSGGGGGGAGGGVGTPGKGGKASGGVFGLFLMHSGSTALTYSALHIGPGMAGGVGGNGGLGGLGGWGGSGGGGGAGGHGGRGGNGGSAGGGGGGAGGPSVAAVVRGAGQSFAWSGTQFINAGGGAGGKSRNAPGGQGGASYAIYAVTAPAGGTFTEGAGNDYFTGLPGAGGDGTTDGAPGAGGVTNF